MKKVLCGVVSVVTYRQWARVFPFFELERGKSYEKSKSDEDFFEREILNFDTRN